MPNFQMLSDFVGICRTCMIETEDLTSVFTLKTINNVTKSYAEMIRLCTSVEILESKQISTSICNECASKISISYEFRSSCLYSKNQINAAFELLNTSILEEDEDFFKDIYDNLQSESESSMGSLDYGDDQINYEIFETAEKTTLLSNEIEIEKNYDSKQKRKYTRKQENPPKQSYLCSICGKILGDRYRFEDHYKMHFPEKCIKCRFCDKVFAIAANCKIHEKLHSEERPFSCSYCPHTAKTEGNLKLHERSHTGLRPYSCEFCEKTFITSSRRLDHTRRIHLMNKKKYKCDICNKEVTSTQALKNHKLRHDKIERPKYPCNVCGKIYKYNKTLAVHAKTCQTEIKKNSEETSTEIIETEIIESEIYDTEMVETETFPAELNLNIEIHN